MSAPCCDQIQANLTDKTNFILLSERVGLNGLWETCPLGVLVKSVTTCSKWISFSFVNILVLHTVSFLLGIYVKWIHKPTHHQASWDKALLGSTPSTHWASTPMCGSGTVSMGHESTRTQLHGNWRD